MCHLLAFYVNNIANIYFKEIYFHMFEIHREISYALFTKQKGKPKMAIKKENNANDCNNENDKISVIVKTILSPTMGTLIEYVKVSTRGYGSEGDLE